MAQAGLWLKLKTTHTNPEMPYRYMNPEVRQRALKELTNAKGVVSLEAEQAALEKLSSRADNTPIVSPQATEEAPAETETI